MAKDLSWGGGVSALPHAISFFPFTEKCVIYNPKENVRDGFHIKFQILVLAAAPPILAEKFYFSSKFPLHYAGGSAAVLLPPRRKSRKLAAR